ncbi:MAG: DUF3857 domain-containing protein [Kiritimatiellae bacterium]|nr:DUF3857 domain-containing protein [Kiritimatiellia bacterium]
MKKPFRLPIPFAVLAAACTTGCCSFCMRPIDPVYWDYDFEPPAAKVETHAESAEVAESDSHAEFAEVAESDSHAESAEVAESDFHAEFAESAELDFDLGLVNNDGNGGNGEQSHEVEVEPLPVESASARLPSVTVEAYPDADEVSVFEWEETRYETNGTYATTWTTLSKILTQRGLENNRTFTFSNNDFYGSTTVLVARVISPDGIARDVDLAANLAEATDTSSLASNIHDPNDKTFTLALPGLQVGDTVELVMRRTAKKPRCEGVYSDYLTFESDHPILFQGACITGPASMPLRSRAFRDAGPVELTHAAHTNEAAGTVTEVWTAENVPRYFAEPDMPPAYDCTARLLLSTAPDWESLSRWYARLCAPHLAATNGAMAAKVAELVTTATGSATNEREAAIRALFDFVSREVRYMGAMAESEAPGYEPHDVSLTFANRYGVCRDKAALLVAMLRMAGIDAWPVLINVGPRKDPQVPQPYFNHAIVAADSGDPANPYLLMDPTSETTRSLLPEYLCEMSYLVARDEGETIRETPPLPVEGNLLQANTVFTLNGDASADVSTTMSFAGVNDAAYRGYFASIPRDNIRAFFERVLQGVPGAVLTRWELHPAPEELRRSPEPLVATVEYAVAEAARGAEGGRTALLDVPGLPARLAIASRVVGDLGLEKRRFPLVTDYPCGFEETMELRLPRGVSVGSAPEVTFPTDSHAEFAESAESDLDLGFVDNCEQLRFVNNPIVLFQDIPTNAPSGAPGRYRSLKLLRSRYSPEEYQLLRESRVAEERAGRAPILLEGEGVPRLFEGRAFGDGLSNVLARAVEPAPADDTFLEWQRTTVDVSRAPEEWTVETTTCRRILTYAGQRKAGDVTLRWNPATTDLRVTNACVVLPDGTATPVDPKLDLFEGDQEWVAGAPRYPAGKIATVSFPKLAPGCAVEYTVLRRAHDRDLFSFSQTLGSLGSFGEISVTVVGTNETAWSFVVDDPYWKTIADRFPVETTSTETSTTYTVRGGGPGSQVVAEPNMPPLHRLAPVLRASSQTAPERAAALAARMWALSDPATQTNAAALARSLVQEGYDPNVRRRIVFDEYSVVEPGTGPGAAVVAIRDWCAVNLREAGPAYWDLPLSALSPADATLDARYGHEADIRILQLAMLRALGLCDRLGIFAAGTFLRLYDADWDGAPPAARDLSFASPSTFDTIDFSVTEATWGPLSVIGGLSWSLDGATQYAPPLMCRNEGRSCLTVALPPAEAAPDTRVVVVEPDSPGPGEGLWGPVYPGQSGVESEYTIRVREDGSAEIGVSVSHSGCDFEAFRKRYEEILPEERRRDAQRLAAALSQSAKLQGEVVTETPANGPCAKLVFSVEVPDFAVRDGDRLVFRLPGGLPLSPQARERRFPFRRASDDLACTACSVWIPDGWRVAAAPSAVSRGSRRTEWTETTGKDGRRHAKCVKHSPPADRATFEREVSFDEGAGILRVRTQRILDRAEFAPSLFPAFQSDSLRTRGADAETVVLERTP